jgi:DNA repair protein RecO (recombination protein O)
MASEKTQAIVLRVIDFSETSAVVTLFTSDFGKISALAKGARRPKGPFENALDLLSLVRVLFLRKSSDALDLLTEARLERRFRSAGRDLTRLYAGYYLAELLMEMTDNHDPHPELFAAADQALQGLDTDAPLAATVLRFELTALRLLGHLPSLDECVSCGRSVEGQGRVAFGLLAGGVLCDTCRSGQRHVVSLSGAALGAIKTFAELSEPGHVLPELEPKVRGELRGVINNYMAHLLGHKPKMQPYLGALAS